MAYTRDALARPEPVEKKEDKGKKDIRKAVQASVTVATLIQMVEERAAGEALGNMPRGRLERLYAAAVESGREAQEDGRLSSWQSENIPDIDTMIAALEDTEDRFRWKPKPKQPEAGRIYEPGPLDGAEGSWPYVTEFHNAHLGSIAGTQAIEYEGSLSEINAETGDGFISCDETQARFRCDVHVASALLPAGLAVHDKVAFYFALSEKGRPQATSVRKLEPEDTLQRVHKVEDTLHRVPLPEDVPDGAPVSMEHSEAVIEAEPAKKLGPPDLETLKRIVQARRGRSHHQSLRQQQHGT